MYSINNNQVFVMSYMRMGTKRGDSAGLGKPGPRIDKGYMYTSSRWAAMAYLHGGLITEGAPTELTRVMPSKVIMDVRYGVERAGLSQKTVAFHEGPSPVGPVVGYITQVVSGGRTLGFYALRTRVQSVDEREAFEGKLKKSFNQTRQNL